MYSAWPPSPSAHLFASISFLFHAKHAALTLLGQSAPIIKQNSWLRCQAFARCDRVGAPSDRKDWLSKNRNALSCYVLLSRIEGIGIDLGRSPKFALLHCVGGRLSSHATLELLWLLGEPASDTEPGVSIPGLQLRI